MRIVGLISGGKDSLYNMLQCIAAGHEIVAIANIEPESKDDLDSYMFQSVGHEVISLISISLGLPIYRHKTKGYAFCKNKVYDKTSQDEVEDLFELLSKVKRDKNIDGVSVGAIASDYQRTRIENVCSRLSLVCFAYLWRRNQAELLEEMINAQIDAIVIKVGCIGLNPITHLGMHIREIQPHLLDLKEKFGVNVCGEGGEYETLTLNCPLYNSIIEIIESEKTISSNDAFAPVGFLYVKKAALESKNSENSDPLVYYLNNLKVINSIVKKPYDYIQDCVEKCSETVMLLCFLIELYYRLRWLKTLIFKEKPKTKRIPDIPFPFETEEINANEILEDSLSEHEKDKSYLKSRANFQPKFNESQFILSNSTKCHVNISSGWCCIGNVTGITVTDAFQNLQMHLERNKYNFQDAVFVNLYIRDMTEFSKINKVYSQFMPNTLPPARVCVETNLSPDVNIIMSVIAHKVVSKSQKLLNPSAFLDRDAMHVRSISHWAPANIGPYSQCIRIGGIYYLAGQIPLVPGTMEIVNQPIFNQCKLTLRHVLRILEAMDESLKFSNVLQAICYVTSETIASDVVDLWSFITHAHHCTVASVVVSKLPKNAQLEWEVVACRSDNPEVEEKTENMKDFVVYMKRCVFKEFFASSLVCTFSFCKNTSKKRVNTFTPEELRKVLQNCIQFLRAGCKTGFPLCILKLFYRTTEPTMASAIKNITNSFTDSKIVFTLIPVNACEVPEVCLTVTGVCH